MEGTGQGLNSRDGKILEFDGLRSLAIILLILHHAGVYNFRIFGLSLQSLPKYNSLFLLGSFTFLSGYLLVHSIEKYSLAAFWKSRLWRIVIPYWAALAIFLLRFDLEMSWKDIILHLFGAQMLVSPFLTTPVMTLWYIGMILAYDAIFGVLLKRIRSTPLLVLVIAVIFSSAFLVRAEYGVIARRFFYYFPIFSAGILCAKTNCLGRFTSSRFFLLDKLVVSALGIAVLIPFDAQIGEIVSLPLVVAISIFVLSLVLLALCLFRVVLRGRGQAKLFSYLSVASFFAYLFHRPIWDLALSIYRPEQGTPLSAYLILVGLLLILPVSYLLQKTYNWVVSVIQVQHREPVAAG